MSKFRLLLLIFAFGLICTSSKLYAQKNTNNSKDLATFLKNKNYVAVPLNKYPTGHLYLSATINDTLGIFILDTGAGGTVVEEKREEKFKLSSEKSDIKAVGAGASNMNIKTTIAAVKLADYNSELTIHLMNLDHVNNAFKQLGLEEIDGVIGADILTNGKAIIDYENLILYLQQ